MKLTDLKPASGSRHRRKIIGRGEGSGHGGKGSTRGFKGQTVRSGDGHMTGFEGGQVPLIRRIPKRGFRNTAFREEPDIVNLNVLERDFEPQSDVNPDTLKAKGLVRLGRKIKILGVGPITKALKVRAHAFSKSAEEQIKKVGGSVEKISTVIGAEKNRS
ncbi:MAG TPA: 50S ribosomal protein L15 [Elusimicrobiota bacterium]|nr:50S ribosomal protein L15 [Elusimicrobiota bacterium]